MAGGMLLIPDARSSKAQDDDDERTPPPLTNPRFLYLLTCVSTIGGFLFGYDTGVISGALVLLKTPEVFGLSDMESQSVVSAAVFGAILGAALSSVGNHRFGRRPVILASSVMFTVGSVIMGVAQSFEALLIGRLVVGVAIGFSSMTVPLYIAEVSPPQIRGRLVSTNTVLVTGGQFFACVLAAALSNVSEGWRYMLGLAAIPGAVQLVGFLLLPESPRYLIAQSKKTEAWAALTRIRGTDDVEHEYNTIEAEVQRHQEEIRDIHLLDELRKPTIRRAVVLGCALQALQQFCGINTVMYYGATIIQLAGFADPSTAIWLAAVVAFSNFIFTFVGFSLVERTGRRRLTLGSLVGVIISLVALGTSFYIARHGSTSVSGAPGGPCSAISTCFDCAAHADCGFCGAGNRCVPGDADLALNGTCAAASWHFSSCPTDSKAAGWVILVALFIYLAFFASGMGSMPWTINAEIYPLHIRSYALSAATSVNWLANLLVSFTFLSIINAFTAAGAFWFYAGIATLGLVFVYRELPETKGLELEAIQRLFERRSQAYDEIEKE